MTFMEYLKSLGMQLNSQLIANNFEGYMWLEYPKVAIFIKDKDRDEVDTGRQDCQRDVLAATDNPTKVARLRKFATDLEAYALVLKVKLDHRALKVQGEKEGAAALANANTPVPIQDQIGGDRVLHFTTAFGPIVKSDKLRITSTSDQGCIFCVPARYADNIADRPPSEVKQLFDIHGDLSHYLEFNLEDSRSFESYNSSIDKQLKGQKELKIHSEVLNLSRRNPVWYAWLGKSQGGWAVVPGPYNWGK